MSDSPQDLHKKLLGKKGERLAEKYLKKKGLLSIARNYKTPFGEADLIMQTGEETVFVEVKTRSNEKFGSPKDAVTGEKQKRYYNIARYYGLKTGKEPNARFDVVEVYADGRIEHIPNAF